jgi:TRAP-type mannitol/chloroaromatic compound transport system substrate-binding protein
MDRRTFLKTTTAAAAATTATASITQSLELSSPPSNVTSRQEFVIAVPAAAHRAGDASDLAKDLEIASHGRIILHRTETASPTAAEISAGKYDGALGLFSELCNAPELSLFSGLPGNLSVSPEHLLTWLNAAAGNLFMDESAAEFDLKAFTVAHSGPATGLWADRKLSGLHDFGEANLSTVGLGPSIAGANRQPNHQKSDIRSASLTEFTGPPLAAFIGIPRRNQAVWYREGIHNQGFTTTLALSQSAWNKMSAGDRLLIENMTRSATQQSLAVAGNNGRFVMPSLMADRQTAQLPLPADIAEAIQRTAVQITNEAMHQNPAVSRAFAAYATYYEAVMGTPLPGSATGSIGPLSS